MPTGTRLKTAAIGLPLVVGALTTVWGTAILVLLVLVVAMVEYQALINGIICNADKTRGPVTTRLSLAMLLTVSIALFGAATVWDGIADGPVFFYALLLLAVVDVGSTASNAVSSLSPKRATRRTTSHNNNDTPSFAFDPATVITRTLFNVLGMAIITRGLLCLLLLRRQSLLCTITYVATCWNTDNGALLFGSLGGPDDPMARLLLSTRYQRVLQTLSTRKTWTGVVGGLLLGTLTWVGLDWYFSVLPRDTTTVWPAWIIGLVLAVLAQTGDLLESLLKRAALVKDSGGLLPGHGGVLDRIDSLLLGVPLISFLFVSPA